MIEHSLDILACTRFRKYEGAALMNLKQRHNEQTYQKRSGRVIDRVESLFQIDEYNDIKWSVVCIYWPFIARANEIIFSATRPFFFFLYLMIAQYQPGKRSDAAL